MERQASLNAVPFLVLDSFCVHMMGSIVEKIQALGIEVQHIPGGCTYLYQPINVGINRPIKSATSDQWEDWLDAKDFKTGQDIKSPPRELIAMWIIEGHWMFNLATCKNA